MERYYYKHKKGGNFLNASKPINNDDYVEITETEYNELTKPQEPTETVKAINEAKAYLRKTDYITDKIVHAIVDGNGEELEELKQTYATELAKRREKRALINSLEQKS